MMTRLRRIGFCLLNVWIVFHVLAVFLAPAGMPPASPLLVNAARLARPYNEALFLNHGYHYFAPDPGASTLVEWRIDRDGDIPLTGRFPDEQTQPRLLYHRFFMLAENVEAFAPEAQGPILEGYARYIAEQHNADKVSLSFVRHYPASMIRIQAGGSLEDPDSFERISLGTWNFGNLESETPTMLNPQLIEPDTQESGYDK